MLKLNQKYQEEGNANEYKTKDLGEASLIYATGIPLVRIDRANNICWFVFGEPSRCRELSISYWSGHSLIDARAFNHANAILKSRIFTG